MAIELKIPSVGESVSEVQIGEWQFQVGDFVEEDETVVVIETDKVNVDLPAPTSGTLKEIVKKEGDDAEIGDVVGYLEEGEGEGGGSAGSDEESEDDSDEASDEASEDASEDDSDEASEDDSDEASKDESEDASEDDSDEASEDASEDDSDEASKDASEAETSDTSDEGETRVMPAARRLLEKHGLSVSEVEASGPGGRLLKEDVLRHLEDAESADEPSRDSADRSSSDASSESATPSRAEERQRMTPLRRKVASRLVQAQEEAALLTTFNEIDMSAVMDLRRQYKEDFQKRYEIKLGFMSFFVKATVEALKEIPQVNAEIDGEEIVYKNYQDIGVAVGGGKGLVVPILRNAERMSFAEVEKKIADLASRAQEGKLKLDELEGGTFTISNGGVYGSLLSTPIVNPPQSGILGLHKIEDRPVAIDGEVVIRPMMYVALTYDHRIVDGREAVTFLIKIKEGIEDPSRILLEV